ncbi:MAG: hypothetical protein ACLVAW_30365 [Eisenbergiella massiliensis]
MKKPLPIGVDDFKKLITSGFRKYTRACNYYGAKGGRRFFGNGSRVYPGA